MATQTTGTGGIDADDTFENPLWLDDEEIEMLDLGGVRGGCGEASSDQGPDTQGADENSTDGCMQVEMRGSQCYSGLPPKVAMRRVGALPQIVAASDSTTMGAVQGGIEGAVVAGLIGLLVGKLAGKTGLVAAIGAGVGALGGGYLGYKQASQSLTVTANGQYTVSVAHGSTLNISGPGGTSMSASWGGATTGNVCANYTFNGATSQMCVGTAGDTGTLNISWTDSTGASQTATAAVTVT